MTSSRPLFHIALIRPEIPQNTGNIGRLCHGVGARLHLVHPLGFRTDDKSVRRAGLDYWAHADIVEHQCESDFWQWLDDRPFYIFSTKGKQRYSQAKYKPDGVLIFGAESKGLPMHLIQENGAYRIPIRPTIRSLNLANAVAIAAYQVLFQLDAYYEPTV